jgi:hypothetical protein
MSASLVMFSSRPRASRISRPDESDLEAVPMWCRLNSRHLFEKWFISIGVIGIRDALIAAME